MAKFAATMLSYKAQHLRTHTEFMKTRRSPVVTRWFVLATIIWFVVAWNIFDPLSTIMFDPIKMPDGDYYAEVGKLNEKFYLLIFGPPVALWFVVTCLRRRGLAANYAVDGVLESSAPPARSRRHLFARQIDRLLSRVGED